MFIRRHYAYSRARAVFGLLLAYLVVVWPQPAQSHHSFVTRTTPDGEEAIEVIEGSVRIFRILNPHGALVIDAVGNPKVFGSPVCYSTEDPSRGTLAPALAPDPSAVGAFGLAWSPNIYVCDIRSAGIGCASKPGPLQRTTSPSPPASAKPMSSSSQVVPAVFTCTPASWVAIAALIPG